MKITKSDIKYNKIWLTKDKYIFRTKLGNHWYLKKFLVLYKYFLVERKTIDKSSLLEIAQNFTAFVASIKNSEIQTIANEFFFKPVDLRKPENLIDFESFNNLPDFDDAARKYYIVYLMKLGMQSGIKKGIGQLLYSDKNITISKIREEIPNIKQREISKKIAEGKTPRSVNDSIETIFSDFHAEIRNYRQLLSYRGILPPEKDGYELNEIAKLISVSDSRLIMSIWEHQKMKLRYSNPYTRVTKSEDPEGKFLDGDDFKDFSVNPYIALINVLGELRKIDEKQGYITFEDYKYFICREAPFNLRKVVDKIIEYRGLSEDEKNKIAIVMEDRPKTREFSKNREKTKSEDFHKELSNFVYGIYQYQFTKNKNYYNEMLQYENQKLDVRKPHLFDVFHNFLNIIQNIVEKKYNKKYKRLSNYNSLKLVDEISRDDELHSEYLKKLGIIREHYLKEFGDDINDFYEETLNSWKNYISFIDYELLILCHVILIVLNKYNISDTAEDIEEYDLSISDELVKISGIDIDSLTFILKKLIIQIIKMSTIDYISIIHQFQPKEMIKEKHEIETWLEKQLVDNSYSVIKERLRREHNDLVYVFQSGNRIRKRDYRMIELIEKERMSENRIMGEVRDDYPINKCDVCKTDFISGEPECHHIIPFEIYGPEINYNYAFLCNKCHKVFTHRTRSKEKQDAILQLRLNRIFEKANIVNMIQEGFIQKIHLDFLHKEGFIHIIDKLEFMKLIEDTKINMRDIESFVSRTIPSNKRWNRSMKIVFWYRNRYNYFMERERSDLDPSKCDTCDKKLVKYETECHHIIPKQIKGSETPFNYLYLCFECHKSFTFNRDNRKDLIRNIRTKKLVTQETIVQMIASNEISQEQLQFLCSEGYITNEEQSFLSSLLERS